MARKTKKRSGGVKRIRTKNGIRCQKANGKFTKCPGKKRSR